MDQAQMAAISRGTPIEILKPRSDVVVAVVLSPVLLSDRLLLKTYTPDSGLGGRPQFPFPAACGCLYAKHLVSSYLMARGHRQGSGAPVFAI